MGDTVERLWKVQKYNISRCNSLKVATLSICLSNIQIDKGLVIDGQSKRRRTLDFTIFSAVLQMMDIGEIWR